MLLDQTLYENTISMWAVTALILSLFFSLILHLKFCWGLRVSLASVETILIGISCGLLIVSPVATWAIALICIIQGYRLFGLFRIVRGRVNTFALRNKSLRSELYFSFATLLILGLLWLSEEIDVSFKQILWVFVATQLVVAIVLLKHTLASKQNTVAKIPKKFSIDRELPSLTIAIPARNETQELGECLNTILQTTYPKLEVLVLDDCSQDNTSDIIRKFAHRGVRFLEGKVPNSSWLAKNFAYHQLYEEADGKYILFCGTDARFDQDTLKIIIDSLLANNLDMMSILPVRLTSFSRHFLLQPMRYWRELVLPRFSKTPPTLSTCWVAKKDFIKSAGGFEANKKTIRPEKIFARRAEGLHVYSFVRATSGIGIASIKNLRAQWDTAVRTRYPELKNRPEDVLYSTAWQIFLLLGPFAGFACAIFLQEFNLTLAFVGVVFLLIYINAQVYLMVSGKTNIFRLLLFPVSAFLEIVVTNYSMWAYEFSEVIWKGRNVCLPVLQSNLRLPKLED